MKKNWVFLIFLLSLLLVSCDDESEKNSTIEEGNNIVVQGIVKTTFGEIIPNAKVRVQGKIDISDSDGNYIISDLQEGRSYISVTKDGCEDFQSEIYLDDLTQTFNIDMVIDPITKTESSGYFDEGNVLYYYHVDYEDNAVEHNYNYCRVLKWDLKRFFGMDVSKAILEYRRIYLGKGEIRIYQIPTRKYWDKNDIGDLRFEDLRSYPLILSKSIYSTLELQNFKLDISSYITSVSESENDNGLIVYFSGYAHNSGSTMSLYVE